MVTCIKCYQKHHINLYEARKKHICSNNEKHDIKASDFYGRIILVKPSETESLCLSCTAKSLIITLTNFPPTSDGAHYSVLNDSFSIK